MNKTIQAIQQGLSLTKLLFSLNQEFGGAGEGGSPGTQQSVDSLEWRPRAGGRGDVLHGPASWSFWLLLRKSSLGDTSARDWGQQNPDTPKGLVWLEEVIPGVPVLGGGEGGCTCSGSTLTPGALPTPRRRHVGRRSYRPRDSIVLLNTQQTQNKLQTQGQEEKSPIPYRKYTRCLLAFKVVSPCKSSCSGKCPPYNRNAFS